jgi:hypothetical protein
VCVVSTKTSGFRFSVLWLVWNNSTRRLCMACMQQWQDLPFRIMHIVTDLSAGGGSFLKRIAQKVNYLACNRGNKTCVQKFCKKCCLANLEIKTCIAHGKKEVTVQEEV